MQSPELNTTYYDQLATGYVVTDNVLIYGETLERGTVLGSRGVVTSATKAKKSITFTGTPVSGKKLSVTIAGNKVEITTGSTTLATEVTALVTAINADTTVKEIVTATSSTGKLMIEAKTTGLDGNDITFTADVGESGVVAGALAVEVIGTSVGDELFGAVDSDASVTALRTPKAVLLEDAVAGSVAAVAYCGKFREGLLKFAEGDSINNFKDAMRARGMYVLKAI